jgi:hypothetical protein
MTNVDPWAAAQASTSEGESQVGAAYAPAEDQESQLFSNTVASPSVFNKTHGIGTERTGIITKKPYDRQDVDFNTKSPKFFLQTPELRDGKLRKVGSTPVDAATGKPNQPVMSTFLELDTEYVMDAAEAAAVGRETPYEGTDRVFVAGGADLKVLKKAIEEAGQRGIRITKGADLVGLRFTAKRTGQTPNAGGNPSWVTAMRFDKA